MNLRELVADLECQGKPEASEWPVMGMSEDTMLFSKEIRIDYESETVWLMMEDY